MKTESQGDGGEDSKKNLNEISSRIVKAAFIVHTELGPGLLETVYKVLLAEILREDGLIVQREVPIPIRVRGKVFDEGFRADLIVEQCMIVEAKSVEQLARIHAKQLITHLRLSGLKLGLLINFGGEFLKGNIKRIVNGSVPDLKSPREDQGEHGENMDILL
jgi:GxxExxY protein